MWVLSGGSKKTGIHYSVLRFLKLMVSCYLFIRVDSNNVDIELQKCGAYEVVKLSRQRVTMNDNPAYEEIGVGVH